MFTPDESINPFIFIFRLSAPEHVLKRLFFKLKQQLKVIHMIKTAQEWFEELSDSDRFFATRYAEQAETLNEERHSLSEALNHSFIWDETNEGGEYWRDKHREALLKELQHEKDSL
jgi:hypothetical protein